MVSAITGAFSIFWTGIFHTSIKYLPFSFLVVTIKSLITAPVNAVNMAALYGYFGTGLFLDSSKRPSA